MERGDNSLIVEAAVTKAFDFKEGSPQDIDYWLRLHLVKNFIQSKRMERTAFATLLHDLIICLQRTTAHADDVYGEIVRNSFIRYIELVIGIHSKNSVTKQLSEEEQIEIYKERYKQEYGGY